MAGASQSRLAKAGGNAQLAAQELEQEFQAGAHGWSPAQIAAYTNPATKDAWVAKQIGQSTKGKFSGTLGAIGKAVSTVAPYALPFIPGLGPVAAGLLSAGVGKLSGKSWGGSLKQGLATGAGTALLGGKGIKGLAGVPGKVEKLGGSAISTIGKTLKNPQGGLDLGKIAGIGMGVAQLAGSGAQRKTAQARLGAEDNLRNMLLQRLLERPNFNFTPNAPSAPPVVGG